MPGTAFADVDAGDRDTCAIKSDDWSLHCWRSSTFAPVLKDARRFATVSDHHACAIDDGPRTIRLRGHLGHHQTLGWRRAVLLGKEREWPDRR
jgi:hypothetical protein